MSCPSCGWGGAAPPPAAGAPVGSRSTAAPPLLRRASAAVPARIRHAARWNRDLHLARPAFDLGLFRVDFGVRSNRANFHPTEDIHGYLGYTLFALFSIHLFTALWHQFVWRHRLLQRMWPAVRSGVHSRP